jgi:soluble lytic murein transglycosylase-like protein
MWYKKSQNINNNLKYPDPSTPQIPFVPPEVPNLTKVNNTTPPPPTTPQSWKPNNARVFLNHFVNASKATGISVPLLLSLAFKESSFNPQAVSEKGAYGLMQLMNATKKQQIPEHNIMGGAKKLRTYYDMFGQDMKKALMAYNWGDTNLRAALRGRKRIPGSVQQFAYNVLAGMKNYS